LRPVIGFCITKTCYFFSLQKFSIEFHGWLNVLTRFKC
jgi:hypothetical protein